MLGGGCGQELAHWIVHGRPEKDMYSYDIRQVLQGWSLLGSCCFLEEAAGGGGRSWGGQCAEGGQKPQLT